MIEFYCLGDIQLWFFLLVFIHQFIHFCNIPKIDLLLMNVGLNYLANIHKLIKIHSKIVS